MPIKQYQLIYSCALGDLLLQANDVALTSIQFDGELLGSEMSNPILEKTSKQLDEYFIKKRSIFSIPLQPEGSDFQKLVWTHLQKIPFGKTLSYLQLAKNIGNVLAIRAVANANGKNPLPIIIPCHRVVGSKGELTGFSGGLWRKQFLLEHESLSLFS